MTLKKQTNKNDFSAATNDGLLYIIQLIDESFGLQNVRNQGNAYVTHNFPEQKGDIRFQDTNSLKGDPENRYIRNEASELIETDSQSF